MKLTTLLLMTFTGMLLITSPILSGQSGMSEPWEKETKTCDP